MELGREPPSRRLEPSHPQRCLFRFFTQSSNRLSMRFLAAPKQPTRAHACFHKASGGGCTWDCASPSVEPFHTVSSTL